MYLKTKDRFPHPVRLAGNLLAISLFFTLWTSGLAADSFAAYQTPLELQVLETRLPGILDEFQKDGYSPEEETLGFSKAWSSDFFSPFNYSIYSGTVSLENKKAFIRLEGDSGDVKSR